MHCNKQPLSPLNVVQCLVPSQLLEAALRAHPSLDPERWDKIASAVPSRTRRECLARFKVSCSSTHAPHLLVVRVIETLTPAVCHTFIEQELVDRARAKLATESEKCTS